MRHVSRLARQSPLARMGGSRVRTIVVLASCALVPCVAAERAQVHFLKFPASDATALGQIDKLVVTVSCSWISALQNVPELYNMEMWYDMPSENLLEATARLGAAAAELSHWNGVIGVRVPANADSRACFAVTATAEGRSGIVRKWQGSQLGLPDGA